MERFFDIFCQNKDTADFYVLQGKLEPPTLSGVEVLKSCRLNVIFHVKL